MYTYQEKSARCYVCLKGHLKITALLNAFKKTPKEKEDILQNDFSKQR